MNNISSLIRFSHAGACYGGDGAVLSSGCSGSEGSGISEDVPHSTSEDNCRIGRKAAPTRQCQV